jgi:hypothetical protein
VRACLSDCRRCSSCKSGAVAPDMLRWITPLPNSLPAARERESNAFDLVIRGQTVRPLVRWTGDAAQLRPEMA